MADVNIFVKRFIGQIAYFWLKLAKNKYSIIDPSTLLWSFGGQAR